MEYSTKHLLMTYECIALFKASLEAKQKFNKQLNFEDTSNISNATLMPSMIVNQCLNALCDEMVINGYEYCIDIRTFLTIMYQMPLCHSQRDPIYTPCWKKVLQIIHHLHTRKFKKQKQINPS